MYFLSSFAPSTIIENVKLVESDTIAGLTATEMWTCALSGFNTSDCGINGLVSDKNDIMLLDKAATTFLTQYAGNTGVLVLINGFGDCINNYLKLEKIAFVMSKEQYFKDYIHQIDTIADNVISIDISRINELYAIGWGKLSRSNQNELAVGLGFTDVEQYTAFCIKYGETYSIIDQTFRIENIINRNDNIFIIKRAFNYYIGLKYYASLNNNAQNNQNCKNQLSLDRLYCDYNFNEGLWDSVLGLGYVSPMGLVYSISVLANTISDNDDCQLAARNKYKNCIK